MTDKLHTSRCPSVSVADITDCATSPHTYDEDEGGGEGECFAFYIRDVNVSFFVNEHFVFFVP